MEENRVPEGFECPNCRETDVDKLELDEDDTVTCTSCSTVQG